MRLRFDSMALIVVVGLLATVPGKGYFAILRLYGPTEAAMNNSWKPGDLEKMK